MFIKVHPFDFVRIKSVVPKSIQGYLFDFDVYTGKSSKTPNYMGFGSYVVTNLSEIVFRPINHPVFFDKFFTSYKLMHALTEKSLYATGTVQENRIP